MIGDMSTEIVITFISDVDAEKIDLTRIGIVAGDLTDGGTPVIVVEPDIDGWDGVRPEVACEILRSGLAAAGVWVDIAERSTFEQRLADSMERHKPILDRLADG